MSGSQLWEVHIYHTLEESLGLDKTNLKTLSVRKIISQAGLYSGLVLEIKARIASTNWKNCSLKLRRGDRPGWFVVVEIK